VTSYSLLEVHQLLLACTAYSSILKMEAVDSPEMLVNFYQSTSSQLGKMSPLFARPGVGVFLNQCGVTTALEQNNNNYFLSVFS
jgi:hypothetical protein